MKPYRPFSRVPWLGLLVAGLLCAGGFPSPTVAKDTTAKEAKPVSEESNVAVPMRDGTILRADVYRPSEPGDYPVLVLRTAYGKDGQRKNGIRYAEAGYLVVCQDARGRYDSDGQWESFVRFETHDAEDGYDTVEWAAKLPGSTGKVGTFGASYNAFLQWRTASLAPPSLVAMSAQSIPARYTDLEGPGAIRPGRRLQWWFSTMTPDLRKRAGAPRLTTAKEAKEQWQAESEKWLHFLPFQKLPRLFWEEETKAVLAWMNAPHRDPWQLEKGVPNITVPNLNVIGWFDHCNGNLLLDRAIRTDGKTEAARDGSWTVVGPWSHTGRGGRQVGKLNFGPDAAFNVNAAELRWFDYWLKGDKNGIDAESSYRLFVMGDNQWRDEPEWPLTRAQSKTLYLSGNGHANSPAGDGILTETPPGNAGVDKYEYDPSNPVPTLYAENAFTVPADQKPLADRQDILVYQTEPLTDRLEVTGNPVVELHAATSAKDTDFFARLIDVYPDGTAIDVSLGLVRARYRNGLGQDDPIAPGETVRYEIVLSPTSIAFLPGHRIRLDITSSDFPNYDRNHNTLANPSKDAELINARQTVHHGGAQGSLIRLPVIPAE